MSEAATVDVRISEVIGPAFRDIHRDIREHGHTHYWLKGGRGSCKSSFAAIQVILAVKRDPTLNAVVLRKVANTMRDSVYAQVLWAADVLGVAHEFHASVSPMEIVYKPTGQRILFRGADDPAKLKSVKVRVGRIGLIWFEELDAFFGMHEVRSILQSLARGGGGHIVIYSYNPPRSRDSWANREALASHPERLVHTSSYLEAPQDWLGETFLGEAEALRAVNDAAYRHEYLGEVTGTGGAVFENVIIREVTDEEIAAFDYRYNGVDWGYFPDPWVFERMYHDPTRQRLVIFAEASAVRAGNRETAELVRGHILGGELVMCDAAEPKSVSDYRDLGIDARGAGKYDGSVAHGMKWLQSLSEIVIDPRRAPLAAGEFMGYEYERMRDGTYCSVYRDADNHSIDAVRYAMSSAIVRRFSV